jgi:hypothetical protein
MRSLIALLLVSTLAVALTSCQDAATTSGDSVLGKITYDQFRANSTYNNWFMTGYDSYPTSATRNSFDSSVAIIRSALDTARHSMIMVIRPTCSCQSTQAEMPRVFKALDSAGFPHDKISIYVTDTRMIGFDDVKLQYNITEAPTFLLLKDGVELGRIVKEPDAGKSDEQMLASFFTK